MHKKVFLCVIEKHTTHAMRVVANSLGVGCAALLSLMHKNKTLIYVVHATLIQVNYLVIKKTKTK